MKQKKMLSITLSQLKQLYCQELPELTSLAAESLDEADFKSRISKYLDTQPSAGSSADKQIRLLLSYDGQYIHELSTGEDIEIRTLALLRQFITGQMPDTDMPTDLFIDLYYQFKRLKQPEATPLSPNRIKNRTERWPTGLNKEVVRIREENKERMLHVLIQRIETRKAAATRFHFDEGISYEEKYRMVSEWWNDFRFHLAMAIKSP
ncbi:MAG: KamA family protein, partial [Bacteroides sp.]